MGPLSTPVKILTVMFLFYAFLSCFQSLLCIFPGTASALSLLPTLKSSLAGPFPISFLDRRAAAFRWRPLFGNSPRQS